MVGLDISDRSIKIAEVAGGGMPRLRTVCWSTLAAHLMRRGVVQDVGAVAQAVQAAFERCSPVPVAGRSVVASIPETQSFVRVVDLPAMPEHEMDEAVHWVVRRHLPFDLERVYIDWQSLPNVSGERREVVVGAAQREVVDPLLQVLDALGLSVAALELEAQAVMRCLLPSDPFVTRDIRGVLVIDLGATSTNVVFFDRGAMRFTTSIQLGGDDLTMRLTRQLNVPLEVAQAIKANVGPPDVGQGPAVEAALRTGMRELVRAVERVVREMMVSFSSEQSVHAILLSGGSANLPHLVDVFSEVFSDVSVQLGNPWTNIPREEGSRDVQLSVSDAMHFTTAIGLALRRSEVLVG